MMYAVDGHPTELWKIYCIVVNKYGGQKSMRNYLFLLFALKEQYVPLRLLGSNGYPVIINGREDKGKRRTKIFSVNQNQEGIATYTAVRAMGNPARARANAIVFVMRSSVGGGVDLKHDQTSHYYKRRLCATSIS